MIRYVTQDTHFTSSDGDVHLIREGDRVAIYPPAIHKDPEIFEEPLVRAISIYLYIDIVNLSLHPFANITPAC